MKVENYTARQPRVKFLYGQIQHLLTFLASMLLLPLVSIRTHSTHFSQVITRQADQPRPCNIFSAILRSDEKMNVHNIRIHLMFEKGTPLRNLAQGETQGESYRTVVCLQNTNGVILKIQLFDVRNNQRQRK